MGTIQKNKKLILTIVIALIAGTVGFSVFYQYGRKIWEPIYLRILGKRTIADVIEQYQKQAMQRLQPPFAKSGIDYPPDKMIFIAFKQEKLLELWMMNKGQWKFFKSYPILGASGQVGPKLAEGDRQVPEGFYDIVGLNPNSQCHLSLKLNYPNDFDLKQAKREGRNQPGTNIFIHGSSTSVGCLAMGDRGIEELFVLVHKVGKENVRVIISPCDLRTKEIEPRAKNIAWLPQLYREIKKELAKFQAHRE